MKTQYDTTTIKRRVTGFQQVTKIEELCPLKTAKIVHADENSVWTRFASSFGDSLLCTTERLEQTREVAFEEGWRELTTSNRKARAAYSIDWMYDGNFYVSVQVEYTSGDYSGKWLHEIFSSRQECVSYFLEVARRHFASERYMPDSQREAQLEMQELLRPSLFGFIETAPSP